MGFYKKTISILISITLLSADASFLCAEDLTAYKLAPGSKFSRMQGPEFKNAAQIELNIRDRLKHITSFDLQSLRDIGQASVAEDSIFWASVRGWIFFNKTNKVVIDNYEVQTGKDAYIVEAKINDRSYYCLISRGISSSGYDVSVVPARLVRDARKSGAIKFAHDSMNTKDRAVLNAYLEHEASSDGHSAVDEWIADRMMRGEYMIDSSTAGKDDAKGQDAIYGHSGKRIYDVKNYHHILEQIEIFLKAAGVYRSDIVRIMERMRATPLVLIPHDESEKGMLPTITVNGAEIPVKAHSSEFATYIFEHKDLYRLAESDGDEVRGDGRGWWNEGITYHIGTLLVHEIGARCGMKARVETNNRGKPMRLRNALDDAYTLYMNERKSARLSLPDDISRELSRLAPVNLLDLSERHDYAAGEAVSRKAMKAGFMKRMLLALAGIATLNFVTGCPPKSPTTPPLPTPNAQGPSQPKTSPTPVPIRPSPGVPDYGFANKYTIEEVVRDPQKADAFMKDYCALIARYIAVGIQDGIAIDGWNVDSNTLERRDARFWTAASKDSLYLAILIMLLKGDRYAMILFGITDPAVAKQEAARRFGENIGGWEQFDKDNPVFGGMPTWVKTEGGRRIVANLADLPEEMQRYNAMLKAKLEYRRARSYFPQGAGFSVESIMPTSDWRNRFPVLDAGEWIWPVYTAYHELRKAGETDLAARYEARFRKIMSNIVDMVWDKGLQKVRAEVRIVDTTLRTVDPANYINNIAGYYLDDPFEGIMIAYLLETFKEYTGKPAAEIDAIIQKIWDDIKMKPVSTPWGMIYEGWPVTTNPPDSSPHINWPHWFIPILDNPLALQAAINREVARTQVNLYGFPASANTPGMPGNYTGYDRNVFAPYGATPLIHLYAYRGDVTINNHGLARLLNTVKVDRMIARDGVLDAFSVKDGALHELSFVFTADNQLNPPLAMMGGIALETREALKEGSLSDGPYANRYERLMARTNKEYAEAFGSLAAIGGKPLESADFKMPTPVAKTAYKSVVNPPTGTTVDLLDTWKFPGTDKWGDMMEFRTEGKKVIITNIAKPPNYGHAWAGGGLREMITPKAGSAIYLKGTGSFTLKLEGTKPGVSDIYRKPIPVTLEGDDVWVKVSLTGEEGATFGVIVIDKIQFGTTVAIADMVYSGSPSQNAASVILAPSAAKGKNDMALDSSASSSFAKASEDRSRPQNDGGRGGPQNDSGRTTTQNAAMMRGERYQRHQIGKIAEVVWQSGMGIITPEEAQGQLATLASRLGDTPGERTAVYGAWLGLGVSLLARMGHRRHRMPSDSDIGTIAERIKKGGVEVFIPASQVKPEMRRIIKDKLANTFEGSLRIYERPEQLGNMVSSPDRSIIMTAGLTPEMVEAMREIAPKMTGARFMNFEEIDIAQMSDADYGDYMAEVLSILLAARTITTEEAKDAGSEAYRLLAHLVERHLGDAGEGAVRDYINLIADDSVNMIERMNLLIKMTLKAMPIEEYKVTKPAVQVLWSA